MTIALLIVLVLLILNPEIASNSVLDSSKLWLNTLVPVLLPTMIIIDFLSNSKIIDYLSILLYPLFNFIFKINYVKSSSLIILSIISGAPSSTKAINNAVVNGDIDEYEANRLIYSFSFLSIAYTIFILNRFSINYSLIISLTIISSIIIMKITYKKEKAINKKVKRTYLKPLDVFYSSITKNLNILFTILGIMICFNTILTLFLKYDVLYPFFETLTGHKILFDLNINKKLKDFILVFSLIFLGLSLHFQILYIYDRFKYIKFLIIKIIQALFVSWFLLI